MFKKSGGHIHTQIAFDFELKLDVIARKDILKKSLLQAKEL